MVTTNIKTSTRWKIGDKVQFEMGGPEMIVIGFSPRGNVWCEWERELSYWEEGSFHPEALRWYIDGIKAVEMPSSPDV